MTLPGEQRLTPIVLLSLFLAVLGLASAAFALYEHVVYTHGLATGPSVCSISAYLDCTKVNTSEWSTFFGIPLGAYGVFFYSCLIGTNLAALCTKALSRRDAAAVTLFFSAAASLCSIALMGISHFIIGALCIMCMTLYLVNFLLFGVTARGAWKGRWGEGIRAGFDATIHFLGITLLLLPARTAAASALSRVGFLLVVGIGALAVQLPEMILGYLSSGLPPERDPRLKEQVDAWSMASIDAPRVVDGAGSQSDLREGPADAPISIVEFADFECPACRRMYKTLHEVLREYEGRYTFVFKNFPLDNSCNPSINRQFHLYACTAAYFSRCAGEQGKLKEGVDLVFTDPALDEPQGKTNQQVRDTLIQKATEQLGLDATALRECIDSKRYAGKIAQDVEEGQRLGLVSTPSMWVNGRLLESMSPDVMRAVFNSILAERKR